MREKPHYINLLTKDFFEEYYVSKKMSYPDIREMLLKQGYNIHNGTLHKYAKRLGFGRGFSEARRNWDLDSLDYEKEYIKDDMIEQIDGFLLGDGGISHNKRCKNSRAARLCCGVKYKEFANYLMLPFLNLGAKVAKNNSKSMNQGYVFSGSTRHHPDIYRQYLRWYPENKNGQRIKQPPEDVRITKDSLLKWYLGDGSVVVQNNTISLRLSTDGFSIDKVEMLVDRLRSKGILSHRTAENRIMINANGIPSFFNIIGRKSPIECYNYKFDRVPFWRFESKRMKEVAKELKINYHRLSYFVKKGRIETFRLSPSGRPRFLPNHVDEVKKLIKSGELY
jgi:hypothetical protein